MHGAFASVSSRVCYLRLTSTINLLLIGGTHKQNMNPLSGRLTLLYQKNAHLIDSLIFKRAPAFVYKARPAPLVAELPVFTFHATYPNWFEQQCRYLAENGYRTLNGAETLAAMRDPSTPLTSSVLLTFDDGLKHVWTVAYPILKKYGLKAMCFLIPGCMKSDDRRVRPTLDHVRRGEATEHDILDLNDGEALITWEEARIMHESGVIDFQSHTHLHSLVHVSDRIIDYYSPTYNVHYYGNAHVPLYTENGADVEVRAPAWGHPIYASEPRMSAARRYFDDEQLRRRCIEAVEQGGGEAFFTRKGWRRALDRVVAEYRMNGPLCDRYETPEERDAALVSELARAKHAIEEHLPEHRVTHLCFPWYEARAFAVRAAVEAGYEAAYFGQRKDRATNRPGDDPLGMVRVEEMFLLRLPGNGRASLMDIVRRLWSSRAGRRPCIGYADIIRDQPTSTSTGHRP